MIHNGKYICPLGFIYIVHICENDFNLTNLTLLNIQYIRFEFKTVNGIEALAMRSIK